jgi:glycosyltransferase involved in cell wall biosynthesis
MTVEAVAALKRQGLRPLLVARGGVERHRDEVFARANALGLEVASVPLEGEGAEELAAAIKPVVPADVINVSGYLHGAQLKALYHSADAVLANSGIEPFGLVGLEAMASGGLAFVGVTGEDYATPGYDCISIQTGNPDEIAYHASYLKAAPAASRYVRRSARRTARRYTWAAVIQRVLMPAIREVRGILAVPEWLEVPGSSTEVEPTARRTPGPAAAARLPSSPGGTTEHASVPLEEAGLATV